MGIANKTIDAASHPIPWKHINWQKSNSTVRRLQTRIVQAQKECNARKVRALQFILTRSLAAASLAVRQVTENTGKRTPGIDKQIWRTESQKSNAVCRIRRGQYRAKPLRRIYIPKASDSTKKRPLSIPCMDDRAKQALFLMALDPIAEYYADVNSYGFRKHRSTHDAIAQINILLSRSCSPQWVLEGDIKGCFDNISHDWLIKMIPINKRVLSQWLKAGFIDNHSLYASESGVPQGGIISPTIANLTLDGLELMLKMQFKNQKVNFVRYADDFIITGASKELLENKIKPQVQYFLKQRGLSLSEEKTHITHIDHGFDFLGFHIRKLNKKLLIKPSKASVKRLLAKVKDTIRKSQHLSPSILIAKLNPILRGWVNYYRHASASRTFSYIDSLVWVKLWRWARRRHPNKGLRWIKVKYFLSTERSNWHFYGKTDKGKIIYLLFCRRFKLSRYLKIQNKANPYDPEFVSYFKARLTKLKPSFLNLDLQKLWFNQKGRCPICKEYITLRSGWHAHHITMRCEGGKNVPDNMVLLHPICHEQWHQRDYDTWAGLSRDGLRRA